MSVWSVEDYPQPQGREIPKLRWAREHDFEYLCEADNTEDHWGSYKLLNKGGAEYGWACGNLKHRQEVREREERRFAEGYYETHEAANQ